MESDTFFLQLSESLNLLSEKLNTWLESLVLILPELVLSILVMLLTFLLVGYISKLSRRSFQRFIQSKSLVNLLTNISSTLFVLLSLVLILSILELDQALFGLLTGAGVAGLAVGLALQDPLVNLFSSIMMSSRNPHYNIGDLIEIGGTWGVIQEINLRTTVLKNATGNSVIIPNKRMVQETFTNYTITGQRRVELVCGVAYGDDLDKVEQIAKSTITDQFGREDTSDIDFYFTDFGDSSINFVLRYPLWFDSEKDFMKSRSQSIIALKNAFDEAGISIPFPIRTLDMNGKAFHLTEAEEINIMPQEATA
ncbi:MAG TPA: mechanosensitive ion channel family protein [Saprospiraceae bacterium]|nr:mechanosensitive ion channel family protein [Saprospiraceae bacterium]